MKKAREIIEHVLKNIKAEIKSGTDIIPRTELPFTIPIKFPNYIKKFGEKRFSEFRRHQQKTEMIRTKAISIMKMYEQKGIPSPLTTMQVAITQCGVGECGETSNRAAIELAIKFGDAGIQLPINVIHTIGKPRAPTPCSIKDYYDHALVIIGTMPKDWLSSESSLRAFREWSPDCILLDPSLGIIGQACDAEKLLKGIFDAYQINMIADYTIINPQTDAAKAKAILNVAKEMSEIIKRDLKLETEKLKMTALQSLLDIIKVDLILSSQEKHFFKETQKLLYGNRFIPELSLFKPKSILVSNDLLTWEESGQLLATSSI